MDRPQKQISLWVFLQMIFPLYLLNIVRILFHVTKEDNYYVLLFLVKDSLAFDSNHKPKLANVLHQSAESSLIEASLKDKLCVMHKLIQYMQKFILFFLPFFFCRSLFKQLHLLATWMILVDEILCRYPLQLKQARGLYQEHNKPLKTIFLGILVARC